MRIARVQVFQKSLPVKDGPYTMSGQDVYEMDTTVVRLESDTGVTGWGEVCPVGPLYAPVTAKTVRAALEDIAPKLISAEATPRAIEAAIATAVLGHNYAHSALDIAVHDMLGKIAAFNQLVDRLRIPIEVVDDDFMLFISIGRTNDNLALFFRDRFLRWFVDEIAAGGFLLLLSK